MLASLRTVPASVGLSRRSTCIIILEGGAYTLILRHLTKVSLVTNSNAAPSTSRSSSYFSKRLVIRHHQHQLTHK